MAMVVRMQHRRHEVFPFILLLFHMLLVQLGLRLAVTLKRSIQFLLLFVEFGNFMLTVATVFQTVRLLRFVS